MLRRTFKLVSMSFKALVILILGYIIPFVAIIIVDRTIGLTIYTFCLAFIILFCIIILISFSNYHIKQRRGI